MKLALLLVAVALLAGCTDPYRREPDQTQSAEQALEPGSFFLPRFETASPAHVRATVEVLAGEGIDVFLAHGEACGLYPFEAFTPAANLSTADNGTLEVDVPPGDVCLVLDNNDHAAGAFAGAGEVRVRYQLDVWHTRAR